MIGVSSVTNEKIRHGAGAVMTVKTSIVYVSYVKKL